jgi:hypothetical protein
MAAEQRRIFNARHARAEQLCTHVRAPPRALS